jgi:hypothetical protein
MAGHTEMLSNVIKCVAYNPRLLGSEVSYTRL